MLVIKRNNSELVVVVMLKLCLYVVACESRRFCCGLAWRRSRRIGVTIMSNHLVEATHKLEVKNACKFGTLDINYAFKSEDMDETGEGQTWPITARINIDALSAEIMMQLITEGLKRKLGYAKGVNVKRQPNHERAASMGLALQRLYDGQWKVPSLRIGTGGRNQTPQEAIARRLARAEFKSLLNASEPSLYSESRDEFNQRVSKAVDTYATVDESKFMIAAQAQLDALEESKAKVEFTI